MFRDIESRTLRKVGWRIVPFVMVLYLVSFLDRVNIGFAGLTMNRELGFSPAVFGFGASIFFAGYVLFGLPSNLVLNRVGARRWVALVMVVWGLISGAMALTSGPASFYGLRFALGVAEAGFFPGIILYLSLWFPAPMRAAAVAAFMAAVPLSQAIGSPVSAALLQMPPVLGLSGWRWMFVAEAAPAVILGLMVLAVLTDRPEQANWLSEDERTWLTSTLAAERTARPGDMHEGVWRALVDPRVLVLALAYFGTSAGIYIIGIWSPLIIHDLGLSITQVGAVNGLPPWIAVGGMLAWSWNSDRTGERPWHVAAACVFSAAGFVLAGWSFTLTAVFAALVIVNVGVNASKPPLWAMPTQFLTGPAAAAGIAFINSVGNVGGFIGPWMIGWIKERTGSYTGGLYATAALMVTTAALILLLARAQPKPAPAPAAG